MSNVLEAKNLQKTYHQGGNALDVLTDINVTLEEGEIVALVGQSGSGKSTLLHCLGLLDSPSGGQLILNDTDVSKANERARTKLRQEHLGFVYQFHYLQPEFTALENIMLPQMAAGVSKKQAVEKAKALLNDMGIEERADHRPARLSGGEQQRVAIARALANDPKLLLADEPTGNLDEDTAKRIFDMLLRVVDDRKITALIATHNRQLAKKMTRTLSLEKGGIK